MQTHAQRVHHAQQGVVSRLGARRKRLVQALAPQPRVSRQLRHSMRASDRAQRLQEDVWIGIFERRVQEFGHRRIIDKIISGVEWGESQAGLGLVIIFTLSSDTG